MRRNIIQRTNPFTGTVHLDLGSHRISVKRTKDGYGLYPRGSKRPTLGLYADQKRAVHVAELNLMALTTLEAA